MKKELLKNHLQRILACFNDAIYHEVSNIYSLSKLYPSIGPIHPAECREQHIQSLFFVGLRTTGYYSHSETLYNNPKSLNRRLDLACWLPDIQTWLFIELEHCSPLSGYMNVLTDAIKFKSDTRKSSPPELKCLLVYGFRDEVIRDNFPMKYLKLNNALLKAGFSKINIQTTNLPNGSYKYMQSGLWTFNF
jgi:hypothetical protein